MKKTSIVIVDDHTLIREMWLKLLAEKNNVEVTGDCGDFDEAIELISLKKPDIVLLDINLGNTSGFDAVPLIKENSPATKIIAVSMHSQLVFVRKMLLLDVKGYVTKSSSHIEVFRAIDVVQNGGTYICNEVLESEPELLKALADI